MKFRLIPFVFLFCLSSCGHSVSSPNGGSHISEPTPPSSDDSTSTDSSHSEPSFDDSLDPLSGLVKFLKANGKPGTSGYSWSYSKEYVETGSFGDSECTMTYFSGHYKDPYGKRTFVQPYIEFENTKLAIQAIKDKTLWSKPLGFKVQLRLGDEENVSKASTYLEFFSKETTTYQAYLDIIKDKRPYSGFWYEHGSIMSAKLRQFITDSISFFDSMQQIIYSQYGRHFLTETNFYAEYAPHNGDPLWYSKDKLVRYYVQYS